jgi:cation diffusion facilitator family transporter
MTSRQKALALSFFTVGYNLVEGVVAVTAALLAGSTALLSFGLDSFVESLSGCVMIWRFWKYGTDADDAEVARAEKTATRLVGYTFFLFGGYVVLDACRTLYLQREPEPSIVGIVIAIVSIIVMPALFYSKHKLGKSIGSRSLVADSKETLACSLLSVVLLVGLGVYYVWRIWWVDPVAALGIAGFMFKEGYETLEESE